MREPEQVDKMLNAPEAIKRLEAVDRVLNTEATRDELACCLVILMETLSPGISPERISFYVEAVKEMNSHTEHDLEKWRRWKENQ